MELEDSIHKEIVHYCEVGDGYAKRGQYLEAIALYEKALELVPIPHNEWEAGQWIFVAIGDSYFNLKLFDEAMRWLFLAYNCLDGHENAFILLRIGQCFFEMGNLEKAKDYLFRAFLLEGEGLFVEDDQKYWVYIKEYI